MNQVKTNIFGQSIPNDVCSAPLDTDYECEFSWTVDCCPNLRFYKKGKWKGHSYCLMKRGIGEEG